MPKINIQQLVTDVLRTIAVALNSQELMVVPFSVVLGTWDSLEFLRLGVSSNWFGLACPAHCHPASFAALGFCLLLGLILGATLSAWLIFGILRPPAPVPVHSHHLPPRDLAVERIRRYLHE